MNSFVKSLNENYMPRALQISGNQAILALLHHMDVNDNYIGPPGGGDQWDEEAWDIKRIIKNAVVDGEYKNGWGANGDKLELMEIDNVGYNISSTINELIILSNYTGINLEIISDIDTPQFKNAMSVSQDDPWHVKISMDIEYKISNKKGDTYWNYEGAGKKTITARIPIYNFREPVYMIEPESQLNITINKTIYEMPGEVNLHAQYTNFLECAQAPSFLLRMCGLADNCIEGSGGQGIESLIEEVKSPTASAIDYQYLMQQNPQGLANIPNSQYYIDSSHSYCYNF